MQAWQREYIYQIIIVLLCYFQNVTFFKTWVIENNNFCFLTATAPPMYSSPNEAPPPYSAQAPPQQVSFTSGSVSYLVKTLYHFV